jgi:Asp-tRNA(Asn)/Glu-tRNA(Gln) amidotransferase A subunit family amidase
VKLAQGFDAVKDYQLLTGIQSQSKGPFHFPSSSDYTSLYKSGKVTPVDVARSLLEEIEKTNATLRAWNQINRDQIMREAEESTKRYKAGTTIGPFDGVPIAIKDEVDMEGYYTSFGTGFKKTIQSKVRA